MFENIARFKDVDDEKIEKVCNDFELYDILELYKDNKPVVIK